MIAVENHLELHPEKDEAVAPKKRCSSCGQNLNVKMFAKKRRSFDSRCKVCRNEKFRNRYKAIRLAKKKIQKFAIHKVVEIQNRVSCETDKNATSSKVLESILADLVLDVFMGKKRQ